MHTEFRLNFKKFDKYNYRIYLCFAKGYHNLWHIVQTGDRGSSLLISRVEEISESV